MSAALCKKGRTHAEAILKRVWILMSSDVSLNIAWIQRDGDKFIAVSTGELPRKDDIPKLALGITRIWGQFACAFESVIVDA